MSWQMKEHVIEHVPKLSSLLYLLSIRPAEDGQDDWLGGALASKQNIWYCLGQSSAAEKLVDASRLWVIFENSENFRQIISTHRRSMFHAAKFSQMPYTVKIKKINNSDNNIENPLELRLVEHVMTGITTLWWHGSASGQARHTAKLMGVLKSYRNL